MIKSLYFNCRKMSSFSNDTVQNSRNGSFQNENLGLTIHLSEPINAEHSYFSQYKGLNIPFGLSINHFPKYKEMLHKDASLVDAVNIMIGPPIAESSLKVYTPIVKKVELFCEQHGYPFPYISEPTILHFLARAYKDNNSFSFFGKILPSLKALELVLDIKHSAVTETVKIAVNNIKRKSAASRKPVKKATLFDIHILNDLIVKTIIPHEFELYKINSSEFRAIVRAIIIYYSFCRFSDYTLLLDTDLDDQGSHIVINFKKSKNDQYYEGSSSFIPVRGSVCCPVKVIRLYYRRFHLKFKGNPSSGIYVNFRLAKMNGYHMALANTKLSVGSATTQMRNLLVKSGFNGSVYTEKSFKVGGVTALCDSGEGLENVMVAGRWRNLFTPLHYRNTSVNFRLSIVQNLPHQ